MSYEQPVWELSTLFAWIGKVFPITIIESVSVLLLVLLKCKYYCEKFSTYWPPSVFCHSPISSSVPSLSILARVLSFPSHLASSSVLIPSRITNHNKDFVLIHTILPEWTCPRQTSCITGWKFRVERVEVLDKLLKQKHILHTLFQYQTIMKDTLYMQCLVKWYYLRLLILNAFMTGPCHIMTTC